jgi:ABC-type maltose transport system permease subunit
MQHKKRKRTLIYLLLAYLAISAIAIIVLTHKRPNISAASNGQETAQSFTSEINALQKYRRLLSEVNTVLLFLTALAATLLVASSRFSDESADEQSEVS